MNKSFFDLPKKEKVKIITEATKESNRMQREFMNKCNHCGGDIAVRNPSGYCDHLHYPENCKVCSSPATAGEESWEIEFDRKFTPNSIYPEEVKAWIRNLLEKQRLVWENNKR